ncbi:hypothetical protein DNK01_11445 [Stutzerimonas kirkiae]|nr:hypothetical protein DNK01_11445 [Stutzerimonas kirkiae]
MVQFSRVERMPSGRGTSRGRAQRIELSLLARELGMAIAPLAHARGVALALEAVRPVWVDGDPRLLNELLSNLLDNALAHTPRGGNQVLRTMAPAILEVEDDGPGIPPEDYERVFERFYQRNPQAGGSGLGQAIVGEICRAHQARVSLHQALPNGLRVRVEFARA